MEKKRKKERGEDLGILHAMSLQDILFGKRKKKEKEIPNSWYYNEKSKHVPISYKYS